VKKPYLIGLLFIFLIAMSSMVLLAQNNADDKGIVNDPATNPRANACFTGGSLFGKCDADWKWVCGWGIIRVEEGILNRAVLIPQCQSLMPALAPTYTPQASNEDDKPTPFPTKTPEPK
jgi:hypothetical protein